MKTMWSNERVQKEFQSERWVLVQWEFVYLEEVEMLLQWCGCEPQVCALKTLRSAWYEVTLKDMSVTLRVEDISKLMFVSEELKVLQLFWIHTGLDYFSTMKTMFGNFVMTYNTVGRVNSQHSPEWETGCVFISTSDIIDCDWFHFSGN